MAREKSSIWNNEVRQQMNMASPRNTFRRSRSHSTSMYQSKVFGYCFSCTKFGHKEKDYKTCDGMRCRGNDKVPRSRHLDQIKILSQQFSQILNSNVEFYTCHNKGHITQDCRLNSRWYNKEGLPYSVKGWRIGQGGARLGMSPQDPSANISSR